MKFYPYKKACALLVTGALTTGAAVPALAAETKTAAPATAEEAKAQPMTLKEIQELVVKNNRLKTTLTLNQEKVLAGLSAIDDGLKDLKDSQDKAAHARRDAGTSASQGQAGLGQITSGFNRFSCVGCCIRRFGKHHKRSPFRCSQNRKRHGNPRG